MSDDEPSDDLRAAIKADKLAREQSDEWKENNLEYDLRNTDWIVAKAKSSEYYAQNIYAALCNMQWQKMDVVPILRDEFWSCSWRYAGGLVAELIEAGDYMDYYCSGIGNKLDEVENRKGYVSESEVTDEIREDFAKIGWQPVPYTDNAY